MYNFVHCNIPLFVHSYSIINNEAWRKKKDDLGEELADVAIYLLGLSEILKIDLEKEILHKIYKNSKREYKVIDGVNMRVKEYEEE